MSQLAFLVDGANLCRGSTISKIERYRINEEYPTRGVHSSALNSCLGARIWIRHPASRTDCVLEVRVFNDGIGFRFTLAGEGTGTPDEATSFAFPAGSTAWFHDFEGHYEGTHQKKSIASVKEGEWAAPPLTIKLPGTNGYAGDYRSGFGRLCGHGSAGRWPKRFHNGSRSCVAGQPSFRFAFRKRGSEAFVKAGDD